MSVSFLPVFPFSLKEDVSLNYFTWNFSKLSPTKGALFELVTNIVLCILFLSRPISPKNMIPFLPARVQKSGII